MSAKLEVLVRQIRLETARVRSFELVDPDGGTLPAFTAGAHVDVFLGPRLARSYSVMSDPVEPDRYAIAVLNEHASRGGSKHMHGEVRVGDRLSITAPSNNFPLDPGAAHSILIAGGIGVTPILSMCRVLAREGASFELHYCARSRAETAFVEMLERSDFADRVTFHFDGGDPVNNGIDLDTLLGEAPRTGTHLYCCGPAGLMGAVERASGHWPDGTVHFEAFTAVPREESGETAGKAAGESGDGTFTVVISSTGAELEVPTGRTVLEVLWDNGVDVDAVCQEGVCGTCLVNVLEGMPDHRDSILTDEEHAENNIMTVCCSRALGDRLVLDL